MSDNNRTVFGYAAPDLKELQKPAKEEPSQTTQADGARTVFDENPYGQQVGSAAQAVPPAPAPAPEGVAQAAPQPEAHMAAQGQGPGAAQSQPMPSAQGQSPQQAPHQAQGYPPQQGPQGFAPQQPQGFAPANAPYHSAPNMQAMSEAPKDRRMMILLIGGAVAVGLVVLAASLG